MPPKIICYEYIFVEVVSNSEKTFKFILMNVLLVYIIYLTNIYKVYKHTITNYYNIKYIYIHKIYIIIYNI